MSRNILHFILSILCLICFTASGASAAKKSKSKTAKSHAIVSPISPPTSLVVDMNSGKVLHSVNATESIYPASLAKLMTIYLAFEALEAGKMSMGDYIPVSKRAEAELPCKLGLRSGETIKVKDAVDALVVKSANDAAVALGEKIAGTEDRFVKLMTKRAHSLGMNDTVFRRASGWHHPEQRTTAIDLAKLTMALKRDFPQYYPLFSQNSFEFRGKTIYGHNPVSRDYEGAEGMKTGFTNPSGFNLITTATRNGKSLLGVVTGSRTAASRNNKMVTLLDQHFGVRSKIAQKPTTKKPVVLASHKAKKKLKSKKSKSIAT
jgi:D-alanyl-D-alanine carboxypeptidase (penicillin-binding protein 5/6)